MTSLLILPDPSILITYIQLNNFKAYNESQTRCELLKQGKGSQRVFFAFSAFPYGPEKAMLPDLLRLGL